MPWTEAGVASAMALPVVTAMLSVTPAVAGVETRTMVLPKPGWVVKAAGVPLTVTLETAETRTGMSTSRVVARWTRVSSVVVFPLREYLSFTSGVFIDAFSQSAGNCGAMRALPFGKSG